MRHLSSSFRTKPRGAALILSLTVTVVVLIIIVGLVRNVLPFMLQSSYFTSANEAYFAAEAALEDALYDMSEQAQGYESVGPNDGRVPVAQVSSPSWIALAASYLSANADDVNFRTPSVSGSSTSINYSTDKFPPDAADNSQCEFYNNDPYRYNFSKCCANTNLNTYRHFCEDGVKKFGLDTDNACIANRIDGKYTMNTGCMNALLSFSEGVYTQQPRASSSQNFKGTSAIGGYAIQSLTNIIPRPGEGTSPSRILVDSTIQSPRDWNKVTLAEPIQIHLAYQQNSVFGTSVEDQDIALHNQFSELCSTSSSTPSSNILLFVRIPLLDTTATNPDDFQYDTNSKHSTDSTIQGTASHGNDDVVLHWQVTGFAKDASGTPNRSKSYTLSSTAATHVYESQINNVTRDTLPNGGDPNPGYAVLDLTTLGTPDIDFATYASGLCGGISYSSPSIYQFMQLVHDPVLRVTMVSNPPLKKDPNLKPPYLEYQVTAGNGLLPNPRAVIQGVGQTLRTEARQFTQTIQTTMRTDIAAPILDFIIFQ